MSLNNETILNTTSSPIGTLVEVDATTYMKLICAAVGWILNAVTLIVCAFIGHNMRRYMWNIVSLTVTDLIMSSGILLHALLEGLTTTNITLITCLKFVVKWFESASILACLCMLLLIAVDQCIGTALPLRSKQIVTRNATKYYIIGVWIFTFFAMLCTVLVNTTAKGGINSYNNRNTCFNLHRDYMVYTNAIFIIVSCPIFLTSYLVIYQKICALRNRRDSQRGRRTSIKKATITTLLLVVPFVLIYVPVSIYILVISAFEIRVAWPFWECFMIVLAGHTIYNPVCYAMRVEAIQEGYKRVFRKYSIHHKCIKPNETTRVSRCNS